MKKMKKFLALWLVFLILICTGGNLVLASDLNTSDEDMQKINKELKGIIYSDLDINKKIDVDVEINNVELKVKEETLAFTGNVNYNNDEFTIRLSGKIFESPMEFFKGNKVILDIDSNNSELEVLHFSIERDSQPIFLLDENKLLEGENIIRIALLDDKDNIIYFENDIDNDIIQEIFNNKIDIEKLEDFDAIKNLMSLENWYVPYIETMPVESVEFNEYKNVDNIKTLEEYEKETDKQDNYIRQLRSSSDDDELPTRIKRKYFTKECSKSAYEETGGFYIKSIPYMGSDDVITSFAMQYKAYLRNPDSIKDTSTLKLIINDNNQYMYNRSEDKVIKVSDFGNVDIKNISLNISTGCDIVEEMKFHGEKLNGAPKSGFLKLIKAIGAKCPKVGTVLCAIDEIADAILKKEDVSVSADNDTEEVTYGTYKGQLKDYEGRLVKSAQETLKSKYYLNEENSYASLNVRLGKNESSTASKGNVAFTYGFDIYCNSLKEDPVKETFLGERFSRE